MLYLQDAALALLETCGSCMKGWCALRAWRNPRSHDVTSKNDNNLRIAQVWNLHPRTLTAGTWEYTTGSSETHLPNHPFSGSMLIFRGCSISDLFCFCVILGSLMFLPKIAWCHLNTSYKIHLCSFAGFFHFFTNAVPIKRHLGVEKSWNKFMKNTTSNRFLNENPLHLPHTFSMEILKKHLWNTAWWFRNLAFTSWGKGSWNLPLFTTGVSTIPNRWLVGLGDFWRMKKPTSNRWIPAYPLPLRVARQFEWSWICHRWVKSWGCSIPMSRDGFS